MENELQIKELVRFCTAAHFDKLNLAISQTKIMKFLYKATTEISDDNPLKNSIPFYWYIHGPYSEPLLKITKQLLQENILKRDGKRYIASKTRLCEHDIHLEEIRNALIKILNSSAAVSANTVIDELYAHEAPYGFYISYKSRFCAILHNYFHDKDSRFKHKQLENMLHTTIGELPNKPLFSRFKYAYLDFIDIMLQILKEDLSEDNKRHLENVTWKLFETFAKGVRILHHDSYFEDKIDGWKTQFEDSINEMEQNIDQLHGLSKRLGSKSTNLMDFQSLMNKILNLKSKDELVMVSFLPPKNDAELNYGKIDAALFKKMNDDEFEALLKKFENSHNAIIHHSTKKAMASTTYRLLAT